MCLYFCRKSTKKLFSRFFHSLPVASIQSTAGAVNVINNTDKDRQLFQNLFKNYVTTDEAFNTDVDKVLKK